LTQKLINFDNDSIQGIGGICKTLRSIPFYQAKPRHKIKFKKI
jgi:hypothetical protein